MEKLISGKVLEITGTLMEGVTGTNLNELVLRAIEVYNRYRSPEATAKLVRIEKDNFVIEFEGAFCLGCGVRDYFEDFICELEDLSSNFRVKIKKVEPADPQSFRVKYVVKGAISYEEALFREFLQERGLSFKEYLASNACTKDVVKFHFRTWLFERKIEK
uniref:Uncharacterized protein n=1 Tax=uncultured miscellaneous Crenarchaeota group TaxID=1368239 RepID=W8RW66_9ARCH|nr:hypothetical protein DKAM_0430 [uncultured miscellaneous Crenarchaeota group]